MAKTFEAIMQDKLERIHNLFSKQGLTLAFAESCTGGLLSSWVTSLSGSSKYFMGAVVSYSEYSKAHLLGVKSTTMKAMGQVSEPTAKAMAQGVRESIKADWSVSITGIAGPTGGTKEKPVGTVCFAVIGPGYEKTLTNQFVNDSRSQIQWDSAAMALDLLWAGVSGTDEVRKKS